MPDQPAPHTVTVDTNDSVEEVPGVSGITVAENGVLALSDENDWVIAVFRDWNFAVPTPTPEETPDAR